MRAFLQGLDMTKPERTFSAAPSDMAGEVKFDLSDIFYSNTDARGVIRSANSVFCRISGYALDDLVGAPHRIVRHPDMPKALFALLWRRLDAGKPVGAYVKNLCRDGRYYWVFAVITSCNDGHLSVRIKPNSPLLPKVAQIYAACRDLEDSGAGTDASVQLLLDQLKVLGFDTYDEFQSRSLAQEYAARQSKLSGDLQTLPRRMHAMCDAALGMKTVTSGMLQEFRAVRTIPMNMRIMASRLEQAGGPISAISMNYGAMLDEMSAWIRDFSEGKDCQLERIAQAILFAQFVSLAGGLQKQLVAAQTRSGDSDEMSMLDTHEQYLRRLAGQAMEHVEDEAKALARGVLDMKRYVTGLNSTRMLCKIESACLDVGGQALAGIVDQLDGCQQTIEEKLAQISEMNGTIQSNVGLVQATRT